jgi:hypothetical protein
MFAGIGKPPWHLLFTAEYRLRNAILQLHISAMKLLNQRLDIILSEILSTGVPPASPFFASLCQVIPKLACCWVMRSPVTCFHCCDGGLKGFVLTAAQRDHSR